MKISVANASQVPLAVAVAAAIEAGTIEDHKRAMERVDFEITAAVFQTLAAQLLRSDKLPDIDLQAEVAVRLDRVRLLVNFVRTGWVQ